MTAMTIRTMNTKMTKMTSTNAASGFVFSGEGARRVGRIRMERGIPLSDLDTEPTSNDNY